ncbi:MAG TPA: hypothetical protein ENF87_02600, partial [Thermoproteales archaeon]|nr:hypothetical protein [Thermoproteales archaeon]
MRLMVSFFLQTLCLLTSSINFSTSGEDIEDHYIISFNHKNLYMVKVGFIVNPIAGMGGRVGLKGTDGVLEEALRRGATPVAPKRAREFLRALRELDVDAFFLAVSSPMGSELLEKEGFDYKVVLNVTSRTTAEDTKKAARIMSSQVDILVFVGGDGTARDVLDVVDQKIPVIGVPAGVKMYSSVFGVNPRACAYLLKCFIEKRCGLKLAEVMDVDEEAFR